MEHCPSCKKEVVEGLPFCPYCGTKRATTSNNDNTFNNEDPYQIFQISRNVEPEIIEAVYRSLVKKYHPDNGINENDERIKKINWAYSILRDKEKRSKWDSEHQRQEPNETSPAEPQKATIPHTSENVSHQNKLTVLIISAFSLFVIIFLAISLSIYHQEYNKMSSFYATSNAKVNHNNTEINRLSSNVITLSSFQFAQESTISAYQATLTTSGEPYQKSSGSLRHTPNDGYIEEYCIDEFKDFIAEVVFINPYKATYNAGWDYGLLFNNQGSNDQYRLVISSDSRWSLSQGVSDPIQSGWITNLITSENGQNNLKVIVYNNLASFFINGTFVSSVSLPSNVEMGTLCIATGMYEGDEVKGETTEYLDFSVHPLIPVK